MPIICRLLGLTADEAATLERDHTALPEVVAQSNNHTEVYWFWHGIDHLLAEVEAPTAAHCLRAGGIEMGATLEMPPARLHLAPSLRKINTALGEVAPEALFAGYDPATMDAAHVYPELWAELDEEHDIIGDLLEHYSYMQDFVANRIEADGALLVVYERRDDETDF
jgi:hypothetical protein